MFLGPGEEHSTWTLEERDLLYTSLPNSPEPILGDAKSIKAVDFGSSPTSLVYMQDSGTLVVASKTDGVRALKNGKVEAIEELNGFVRLSLALADITKRWLMK